ncbi:MAG: DUF1800 family protein [Burkholderiales bacterium]|nr:DUF1800 family protein [Burkholderiales bacterium]
MGRARAGIGCFAAGMLAVTGAHAGLGTAVEFYNPKNNHYFLTANPAEAAMLDAGTTVKGWSRTGGQFTVFTEPAEGLAAVCRFFGTPGRGPDSHFYTADTAECDKVRTLPAWTFEEVAFYIPLPSNGDCGANWPVYRSYYSDQIADANHRFTVDLTAHVRMPKRRGDVLEGIVMCAPVTDEEREADVVRFLEQATLGPTEALVAEVKAKGIEKYLDEQIPMNVTRYTQHAYFYPPMGVPCIDDVTPPVTPEKFCYTNKMSLKPVAYEFFRQSRSAPDQVRVRMAHVWHQIFVAAVASTYGTAEFHQRFRDHAFGTFENLLKRYSLSPQLGQFQTWVNNIPEHDGIKPNENYARELMQLFSIGPNVLEEDGTPRLDGQQQFVPTYSQSDIETMARILTGYSYPTLPGNAPQFYVPEGFNYAGDMEPFEKFHDKGAKTLLGGRLTLVAGGSAPAEVNAAIAMLVNHPNTPPFIVKQLIQKTVTSSPSPGYVARAVAVFKDNGKGVRGDLGAVTRAILLDPEARGARKIDQEYGRMREPVLFMTAMLRALDIATDGVQPHDFGYGSNQFLFAPPTVFGYYPADYTLAGSSIPAPEFGIFGSVEFANRANTLSVLLWYDDRPPPPPSIFDPFGPRPYIANATGTKSPTLAAFLANAADPPVLIERLNRLFLHGAMWSQMRSTLEIAIGKIPASDPLRRARLAIDLVLSSIDYQVQK